MNKCGLKTSILGILVMGLVFIACEPNSPIGLEESLKDTPNVQLVEGATDVSVKVNKNHRSSYFSLELDNLMPESNIANGSYEAWCVLWNTPIDSDGGVYTGTKLHKIDQDASYQRANYIIGNKRALANELGADWKEIQVAIWSVLDFPKFNFRESLLEMPSYFHSGGAATFDTEVVDQIVSRALQFSSDYVNTSGEVYLLETANGTQNVLISRETAMARMVNDPDDRTYALGQAWFTYVALEANENSRQYFIYAGQHTFVGYLDLTRDGNNLNVKFSYLPTVVSVETHVQVVGDPGDFPNNFGGYWYNQSHSPALNELEFSYPLNGLVGEKLYISAHSVVQGE